MSYSFHSSIASPYLKAITKLDDKAQDSICNDLLTLVPLIQDDQISKAIHHPAMDQMRLAKCLFTLCKISDQSQRLILSLAHYRRLNIIPVVAEDLKKQRLKQKGMAHANIVSAYPLSTTVLKKIHHKLESNFNLKFESTVQVDESLLGGVVIQYDNNRMDASIKSSLKKMHQSLCSQGGNL